jgi:hypothetical protein
LSMPFCNLHAKCLCAVRCGASPLVIIAHLIVGGEDQQTQAVRETSSPASLFAGLNLDPN